MRKSDKKDLCTLAGIALFAAIAVMGFTVSANAWDVKDLNKTIDQTNFVLGGKCSATLISIKHRLLLTNYHCVSDDISTREKEVVGKDGTVKKVKVLEYRDVAVEQRYYKDYRRVGKTEYQAVIVAHKQRSDLALVQIRTEKLPYTVEARILPKGMDVYRGDKVYAVGNPLVILDASVTTGVVSSTNRAFRVFWADNATVPFIQFSAVIVGGNSGGALYNDKGYLVGVPAASIRGLSLAIPYQTIRTFLSENCYGALWGGEDAKSCKKGVKKASIHSVPYQVMPTRYEALCKKAVAMKGIRPLVCTQ